MWLRQRSVRSANQATHNSLAGGLYKIELAEYPALFATIEIDIGLKRPFYLVEKRSAIFPFILDFDLCYEREYSTAEWLELISIVQSTLPDFGVGSERTCYALRVDPVPLADGSVKNGLHLYWPDVLVDQPTALAMHQLIVQRVVADRGEDVDWHPDGKPAAKWAQVIDPSVLKANGLRLPYANKASKCKCNNNNMCTTCDGTGYCEGGRPYKPWLVVDIDGTIKEDATVAWIDPANIRQVFTKTVLHTTHAAPPRTYTVPAHLVLPVQSSSSSQRAMRLTNANGLRSADGNYVLSVAGRNVRVSAIINPEIYSLLCRAVRESGLCGPNKQEFKNMMYCSEDHRVYMLIGLNKYCNNKGGTHGGQDVYYVINKDGVMQRCWSAKACSRYSSLPVRLDALIEQVLFPITNRLVFGSDADILQCCRAHRLLENKRDPVVIPRLFDALESRVIAMAEAVHPDDSSKLVEYMSVNDRSCDFVSAGFPKFISESTQDSQPK
jgi:hypothetical protein